MADDAPDMLGQFYFMVEWGENGCKIDTHPLLTPYSKFVWGKNTTKEVGAKYVFRISYTFIVWDPVDVGLMSVNI